MKICLVHDDFVQSGGAESLFATIAELYPDAPIYTSLVNWQKLPASIGKNRVRPSFMQKIPFATKLYKLLLPLYPLAFESFDFDGFDLVISSTTRFAKAVITKPGTAHICYINSTPRFLYEEEKKSDYLHWTVSILMSPYLKWLKKWDKASSARVDLYIANSTNVQAKIKNQYHRDAQVVYPSCDTAFFRPSNQTGIQSDKKDYYLVVSRLVKWKKIDIAIKALQEIKANLIIIGDGPDKERLERMATNGKQKAIRDAKEKTESKITFAVWVTREELRTLYWGAKALIITQEEDFGISAVEAQACGAPVIAYGKGGLREIIQDKKTGIFFDSQDSSSLKDAIFTSSRLKYNKLAIRNNALRFAKTNFEEKLKETVSQYVKPA